MHYVIPLALDNNRGRGTADLRHSPVLSRLPGQKAGRAASATGPALRARRGPLGLDRARAAHSQRHAGSLIHE